MPHSNEIDEQMIRQMAAFEKRMRKGDDDVLRNLVAERPAVNQAIDPTGEFPGGKLTEDDRGEVAIAVGVSEGKVVVDFGTNVTWIAMDRVDAHNLGRRLVKLAKKLKREELKR